MVVVVVVVVEEEVMVVEEEEAGGGAGGTSVRILIFSPALFAMFACILARGTRHSYLVTDLAMSPSVDHRGLLPSPCSSLLRHHPVQPVTLHTTFICQEGAKFPDIQLQDQRRRSTHQPLPSGSP